ncbi:MAG: DUF364 domain-containing protein [Anaerolineales bacterium]|nr:DUF364 domain-containing protein [Anaerolineales bacterium]
MGLLEGLPVTAAEADVVDDCLGLHWTGVWVRTPRGERCGLASTLCPSPEPARLASPAVADAGQLDSMRLPRGGPEASLGPATLQAMIPLNQNRWTQGNADQVLAWRCRGKRVVLVGKFHFAALLGPLAASPTVLELEPLQGERPGDQAAEVLAASDLIVITGMALVNRTLDGLLPLCPPDGQVALVGPSVPLSEVLFGHGVSLLRGAFVEKPAQVMAGIRQGADFHPVRRLGVRVGIFGR